MSVDPRFDLAAATRLQKLLKDQFPSALQMFQSHTQGYIDNIGTALQLGDLMEAREVAHKLASSSAQFGLVQVSNLTKIIEDEKNDDALNLLTTHRDIHAAFMDAQVFLDEIQPDHIKILFVEDEDSMRMIFKMALEAADFIVEECASGSEAIEKIVKGFTPDILLLDYRMPGMNGEETLAALRAFPTIAKTLTVFVTGQQQPEDRTELLALGVADVLPKTIDPFQLPEKIMALWQNKPMPPVL